MVCAAASHRGSLRPKPDLGLFETGWHSRIGSMLRAERHPMREIFPARIVSVSLALFVFSSLLASAEIADWDAAVRPLDEGIPQVAVLRLEAILKRELSAADRKTATAKLGEALLAAGEAEQALKILEDAS